MYLFTRHGHIYVSLLLSMCSLCILLISADVHNNMPQFVSSSNLAQEKDILEGRRQYEMIQKKSENPKYGDCWKQAVVNLHSGCKQLTEHVQSRLAIHFASCFLEQSGQKSFNCSRKDDVRKCLENVDNNAFASYLEFFTHTQSICLFLQSQVWQENTDRTIAKLSESSNSAAEKLEEANKNQDQILQLQHEFLNSQQKLLEYGENLEKVLENSKTQVSEMLHEFQTATDEQRMVVLELFDQVSKLQSLIVGQFAGFYTFMFFALAVTISFLITSTPRTSSARLWLFIIIIVNALLERLIVSYWAEDEGMQSTLLSDDGPIYQKVWFCRKLMSSLGAVVLMVQAFRYKDYNVLNNRLLQQIREQNLQLKLYLERTVADGVSGGRNMPEDRKSSPLNVQSKDDEAIQTFQNSVCSQSVSNLQDMSTCETPLSPSVVSNHDIDSGVDEGDVAGENIRKIRVPKQRKQRKSSTSSQESFTRRYNLRRRSTTPVLMALDVDSTQSSSSSIKGSISKLRYQEIQEAVNIHASFYSDDDV